LRSIRNLPQVLGKAFVRLKRTEQGNLGDHGSVGEGVIEIRIDFGPGCRVYLGIDGDEIILLWGGTKKTQNEDIKTAKEFWRDYNA
jgi:putative addiction module killer protein